MFACCSTRSRRLIVWALLAAFALRALWGIMIPVQPFSDSHAYDVFAMNIAQGYGYGWEPYRPSAYWPVGTSAIYAALFWLFGHGYTAVVLLQIAVGVGIVALAAALAQRWFNESVAVWTAWLLACWPLLIQFTTILASELFYILFILLAFWLAALPVRSWGLRATLSGVALAAASYVRPIALLMPPVLFIKELATRTSQRKAAIACIVATAVMLMCIAPWTARNWFVFERFVLISTNGGANFWMGNNPSDSTGYMPPRETGIQNEADKDAALRDEAIAYIVRDPTGFLTRSVAKLVKLHDRETIGVAWNEKGIQDTWGTSALFALRLVSSAYWLAILAAALLGVFFYARFSGLLMLATAPPALTWIYFTAVHVITVAGDRYHVPSIPFVAMFAAYAVCRMLDQRKSALRGS